MKVYLLGFFVFLSLCTATNAQLDCNLFHIFTQGDTLSNCTDCAQSGCNWCYESQVCIEPEENCPINEPRIGSLQTAFCNCTRHISEEGFTHPTCTSCFAPDQGARCFYCTQRGSRHNGWCVPNAIANGEWNETCDWATHKELCDEALLPPCANTTGCLNCQRGPKCDFCPNGKCVDKGGCEGTPVKSCNAPAEEEDEGMSQTTMIIIYCSVGGGILILGIILVVIIRIVRFGSVF